MFDTHLVYATLFKVDVCLIVDIHASVAIIFGTECSPWAVILSKWVMVFTTSLKTISLGYKIFKTTRNTREILVFMKKRGGCRGSNRFTHRTKIYL